MFVCEQRRVNISFLLEMLYTALTHFLLVYDIPDDFLHPQVFTPLMCIAVLYICSYDCHVE